jgi:hypothetical protein
MECSNCWRLSKLSILFFFYFGQGVCLAQNKTYWDLQVGLGSYLNFPNSKYWNYHNPRGQGLEVSTLRGRDRKGFGWETGITYRHTAHENVFFVQNQRIDNLVNAGFFLIPAFLTYSVRNLEPTRRVSLKLRTGLYAGWRVYGDDYYVYPNGTRSINTYNGTPSRFPTFEAFGGQLGLKVQYAYKEHINLYLEIRTIMDASGFLYPKYVPYNISFTDYTGRLIGLGSTF